MNYLGSTIQYLCSVDGRTLVVARQNDASAPPVRTGDQVVVSFAPEDCLCLKAAPDGA